jgi:hypothetical protein
MTCSSVDEGFHLVVAGRRSSSAVARRALLLAGLAPSRIVSALVALEGGAPRSTTRGTRLALRPVMHETHSRTRKEATMKTNDKIGSAFATLGADELEAVTGAGSPEGDICRAGSSAYYGALGGAAGTLIGGPVGTLIGGAAGTFLGSLIGARSCKP